MHWLSALRLCVLEVLLGGVCGCGGECGEGVHVWGVGEWNFEGGG